MLKVKSPTILLLILMIATLLMTSCGRAADAQAGSSQSLEPTHTESLEPTSGEPSPEPPSSVTPEPTANPEASPEPISEPEPTATPEATSEPRDNHIDDFSGLSYTIAESIHHESDTVIRYPKVSGVGDSKLDDSINQLIEADAMKLAALYQAEKGTLDVSFEIASAGQKLLSIKFIVYAGIPGAAHPNHAFYTTNIYLPVASKIKLDDLIRVSDYMASAFIKNCRYAGPHPSGDAALELSLQDYLKTVDGAYLELADNENETNECFSYFTPDSVGISVGVPFALGGYALYEAKLEDVISYIYSGNVMWDDFPSLKAKFFNAGNCVIPRIVEDMFVEGWSTLEPGTDRGIAEGDLDRDGNSDVAYVLEFPGARGEAAKRTLVVAFGPIFDTAAADAGNAVLRADEGGVWGDPFDSIEIRNGSLYLHFYAGSNWRWARDYQFRYQDGDFYLIGATMNDFNAVTNEGTKVDYNLQTGDYITTVTDENGKQKSTTGNHVKRNEYKLTDFNPRTADVFKF